MSRAPMKLAISALIVTFASGMPGRAAAPADGIEELWAQLDTAWKARDVETFTALFAEDATFHVVTREPIVEGRAAIRARFAEQFSRQSPELRHVSEVRRVQPLARGTAAVDVAVRVLRPRGDDDPQPEVLRRFAVFAVMTEAADGWKIRGVRIYPLPDAP